MLIQTLDLQNPSFYPDTFRVMRSTTLLSEHGIDFIIRSAANHSNYEWVLVKVFRKGKLKLNGWFYKQELLWKNPQSNRRRMTHGYKWLIKKLCIPVKWSMDNPVVIGYIVCGALCVFAVTLTLMLIGMLMAAIFTGILTAITYVVANAGVFITFAIIATVIWLARP